MEALADKAGRRRGVVAIQNLRVTGPGGDGTVETRPSIAAGLASSIGSTAASKVWTVSSVNVATDGRATVVVVNPSRDTIALVTLSTVTGGQRAAVSEKPIEVPPLGVLPVDVSAPAAAGPVSLEISSPTPVVASARTTSTSRSDLALWPALADVGAVSPLDSLVGG